MNFKCYNIYLYANYDRDNQGNFAQYICVYGCSQPLRVNEIYYYQVCRDIIYISSSQYMYSSFILTKIRMYCSYALHLFSYLTIVLPFSNSTQVTVWNIVMPWFHHQPKYH